MEKVGIIGIGAMGSALLERLKLAGVTATVFDIDKSALEVARLAGAKIGQSARLVAQASTLIDVVVRNDQEVLDCILGKEGLLEGAQDGTLILLHSTIRPQTTKQIAEAAGKRNVYVIDVCMSSVPKAVREGKLSFLVGGPQDLVDRARPHLLNMARQVLHMGPLGTGNIAKLIKNMVNGAETLIIHEAIRIGEAGGISYPDALEMMSNTYSGSILSHWQGRFDPTGADSWPKGGGNLFNKDLPLAAELGRTLGVEIPITEQLSAACRRLPGWDEKAVR